MQEIIIVSDNHGKRAPIEYLRKTYPVTDIFLHCGDSVMHPYEMEGFVTVQGNNDHFHAFPSEQVIEVEGHRILIVHGHREIGWGNAQPLIDKAKRNECDIVAFGHTHIPCNVKKDGILLLNPGSIWHNRDGSDPSYYVVTIDGENVNVEKKFYKVKEKY